MPRHRLATLVVTLPVVAMMAVCLPVRPDAQQGRSIRGRVDVRVPALQAGRSPDVASVGSHASRRSADRRRAVVYLETAPRSAFEEAGERRARIDQRNETFVPHLLAISVGTTVDFPNNDTTYHNVFSLSRPRPFDLGRYAAGRSRSVTFDRPGIVRVFCEIHSHMSAFILVFSHRFFSVTNDSGRYRIDNVPPGTYTVRVWNEAVDGTAREVVVAHGAGDVELDFSLGHGPS
jgi:plastocyanin